MKYPLPNGYSFQIVRTGANDNGALFSARLVSPIESLGVIAETSGESPFEYPTRRVSAGHILFTMLYDTQLQAILGDAYPDIHDRAIDMSGLSKQKANNV